MAELLSIGLHSWIIQDGNYPDFKVGQVYSFALEFCTREPLKMVHNAQTLEPRYIYKDAAQFEVVGRSIHTGIDWWVMDFGIPAYTTGSATRPDKTGVCFEGNVYVGVDPFNYFERFSRSDNAPALIFDWRVERIELNTAPFFEQSERMFIRDPEKMAWRDLLETNAWQDDEGHAEYVLCCTRLSDQPRHSRNR